MEIKQKKELLYLYNITNIIKYIIHEQNALGMGSIYFCNIYFFEKK